jgi:hypothetical protein
MVGRQPGLALDEKIGLRAIIARADQTSDPQPDPARTKGVPR